MYVDLCRQMVTVKKEKELQRPRDVKINLFPTSYKVDK